MAVVRRTAEETAALVAAHRALLQEMKANGKKQAAHLPASAAAPVAAAHDDDDARVHPGVSPVKKSRSSVRSTRSGRSGRSNWAAFCTSSKVNSRKVRDAIHKAPKNSLPCGVRWTQSQTVALAVAIVKNVHVSDVAPYATTGTVHWANIHRAIFAGEFPQLRTRVPPVWVKCLHDSRNLRKRAVRVDFLDDQYFPTDKARRVAAAATEAGVTAAQALARATSNGR